MASGVRPVPPKYTAAAIAPTAAMKIVTTRDNGGLGANAVGEQRDAQRVSMRAVIAEE